MAARTTRTKTTVLATTLAAAAIAAATSLPAHADTPAQHPATTKTATKQVDYQGYRFTVPRSWTVVDLARHPNTCVRFDRHTLYLGHPGANQACPSHSIGRTEAVLVQPATNPAGAQGTRTNTVAHEIDTTAARVTVTATYNTDRALVQHILTGAHLPTTAPRTGGTVRSHLAQAATAALPSGATNYTGKGFDTCSAPSSSTMSTWKANSPYSSVGVYIGGSNMGCSQPNLTASWVQAQYNAGWRFQPVYVGEQAAAISSPTSEGTAAADDAVTQATNLGFGTGSTLYYDMEQYDTSSYGANVLAFESAWTKELHAKGYHSGLYSSSSSGITDLANNYSSQYTMPDVIFDALWNGSADTNDSVVPSNEWSNHQRAHQYGGNTNETYGGVTINVDDDYLDVQMSTTNVQPMSNLVSVGNGNILAVDQSGNLWRYSAPNYYGSQRVQVGNGWNVMTKLISLDDANGDILAIDTSGNMYRYSGPNYYGSQRVQVGTSWNTMTQVTSTFDGTGDIFAVDGSGNLFRYHAPNYYGSQRTQIGTSWNTMSQIVGVGNTTGSGSDDIIAVDASTGILYRYTGPNYYGSQKVQIGTSWNTMTNLAAIPGNGTTDLLATNISTQNLYRYTGPNYSGSTATQVGNGW